MCSRLDSVESASRQTPGHSLGFPSDLSYDVVVSLMKRRETSTVLLEAIASKLTAEDDCDFWEIALAVVTDEFIQRHDEHSKSGDWVLMIGACSHWLRPHQNRWIAAGGFAAPMGYQNFMPEFDWSLLFVFRAGRWTHVKKLPKRRLKLLRIAVPTRTTRHKQAAIHTRWLPGSEEVLYGFRNIDGNWECLAASDEKARGHIRPNS